MVVRVVLGCEFGVFRQDTRRVVNLRRHFKSFNYVYGLESLVLTGQTPILVTIYG